MGPWLDTLAPLHMPSCLFHQKDASGQFRHPRLYTPLVANPNRPRTSAFGIPWRLPDRVQAVAQYLSRSMLKLRIAEWHLAEFERLEDELTGADFFDFTREPFLPVQAHADGVLVQIAAAFDAFACAVAHRHGLPAPDRADFGGWNERLAEAESGDLAGALREIAAQNEFEGLQLYRNLSAHRGMIGELQRGTAGEPGRDEVQLLLPDWLPEEFPDYPEASVRPILRRYLYWARPCIELLRAAAEHAWSGDSASEQLEADKRDRSERRDGSIEDTTEPTASVALPTEEERAPRSGEWRAWWSGGSSDFLTGTTVPPAWYLKRDEGELHVKSAVGLEVDELRAWLEELAGPEVAKVFLREHRPRHMQTNVGRVLIPSLRR